jgi:hypothetical protein
MLVSYWTHCFPRGSKAPKGAELPYKDADLYRLLQCIKNGYWRAPIDRIRAIDNKDERTALKQKLLHVFKVSGTFIGGDIADIVTYNGLLQIDIDNVPLVAVATIKEALCSFPFVLAVFLSPSMGLKAIVRTAPPDMPKKHWAQWHITAWDQVETYVNDKLQPFKIDRQTRPINKNIFVSYDADLYYNADCTPFTLEPISLDEPQQQPTIDYKKGALPSYTPPNRGSGNRLTEQDFFCIFNNIGSIFSGWGFFWCEKENCWWSPLRLDGSPSNKDKRKTRCSIADDGNIVFSELKSGSGLARHTVGLFKFWGRGDTKKGAFEALKECNKLR